MQVPPHDRGAADTGILMPMPPRAPLNRVAADTPLLAVRRNVESVSIGAPPASSKARPLPKSMLHDSSSDSSDLEDGNSSGVDHCPAVHRRDSLPERLDAGAQGMPIQIQPRVQAAGSERSASSTIHERSASSSELQERSNRSFSSADSARAAPQQQKKAAKVERVQYPANASSVANSSFLLPGVHGGAGNLARGRECAPNEMMLEQENEALKRKLVSFEQQHRFMMSALDREYHLKVKEQERQRTVLGTELDDVLKQLKFGQFECKDKMQAAEASVRQERSKTAAAEKLQKQAAQQRNQLVTQVAALRAEISRRDSQICFEDLSDLLGRDSTSTQPRVSHAAAVDVPMCQPPNNKIKPFAPQRPQTARAVMQDGVSAKGRPDETSSYSQAGASGQGLTRDQLGALRQHVKVLATDKLALVHQLATIQEKYEEAHERAEVCFAKCPPPLFDMRSFSTILPHRVVVGRYFSKKMHRHFDQTLNFQNPGLKTEIPFTSPQQWIGRHISVWVID